MNAYEMLQMVRMNVAESSGAQWSDKEILWKLSANQKRVAMKLMLGPGDWLMTHSNLTPVASVITLPDLCGKAVYLEHTSDEREIKIGGTVRERQLTRLRDDAYSVGELSAYFEGNSLVVNQSGFTDQVTLWYQKRVVDLFTGTGDTSSTTNSLILPAANGPKYEDDYYNGVVFQVVEGTGVGNDFTVTDYVGSTRVATVVGAVSTDTVFGSLSVLPEEGHDLVVVMSTLQCLAKPDSTLSEEVFKYWFSLKQIAENDFAEWASTRKSGSTHVRVTEID